MSLSMRFNNDGCNLNISRISLLFANSVLCLAFSCPAFSRNPSQPNESFTSESSQSSDTAAERRRANAERNWEAIAKLVLSTYA